MRKTLLFSMFFIIVVFLSGCASKEADFSDDYATFDSYVAYSSRTFTYTDLDTSDILDELGSVPVDYMINAESSKEFTESEKEAYSSMLQILEEIDTTFSEFNYGSILDYTSKDIEDFADLIGIELTITDIITFNKIKSDFEEQMTSSYISVLSKQDYVEIRIDRELTDDELDGLYILQNQYFELVMRVETNYSFKTNTFDELLTLFADEMSYIPTEDIEPKLEAAYNVINSLLTE